MTKSGLSYRASRSHQADKMDRRNGSGKRVARTLPDALFLGCRANFLNVKHLTVKTTSDDGVSVYRVIGARALQQGTAIRGNGRNYGMQYYKHEGF